MTTSVGASSGSATAVGASANSGSATAVGASANSGSATAAGASAIRFICVRFVIVIAYHVVDIDLLRIIHLLL